MTYGVLRRAAKAAVVSILAILPAQAETVTVAALGDSLTQGFGLPPEEGFVPQLQNWLQAQGEDVAVLNAGVSGDTTAGGLARVAWTLTPEVDAMIVALGGNDLLRGIAPEVARANLEGIMKEAALREMPVLLIGLEAPGNYGPDYKAAFDAIYPELAAQYGALHAHSFVAALGDDPAEFGKLLQGDGLHPNAQGVARIVEDLGPQVRDLISLARRE